MLNLTSHFIILKLLCTSEELNECLEYLTKFSALRILIINKNCLDKIQIKIKIYFENIVSLKKRSIDAIR